MSIMESDLPSLSERLLVACDQSYAGDKLVVGESHLEPYLDKPSVDRFVPPYSSDFPRDVVQYRVEDDETGFKCVIYQNLASRELIVAMGGADGLNLKDWWSGVTHYGWNQWKLNRPFVLNALQDLIGQTRGPNDEPPRVYFTGQSLGGALAQYAAYEFAETHGLYPKSELALITFNALGGVAALRDEIPNRGNLADLGFPGFRDHEFQPDRAAQFALVTHYWNNNDMVARLGVGHLGGAGSVIEFPGRDFTHIPYALDTISAHRIETGFYYSLTEYAQLQIDAFQAAMPNELNKASAIPDFYLKVDTLQKLVSIAGNLYDKDSTSTVGAFAQLLFGGLITLVSAPAKEVNDFVDEYVHTRYLAGQYEYRPREYAIAMHTDWSLRLRIAYVALTTQPTVGFPYNVALGMAAALALSPIYGLVDTLTSDQVEFLTRTEYNWKWSGVPVADSTAEEALERSDLLAAAFDVQDPRGSGTRLTNFAELSRGAVDALADAMDDATGNWYGDTAAFLVQRGNALGEPARAAQAQAEFWAYSKRAAAGNPELLSTVFEQSQQYLAQWGSAIAGLSSDLVAPINSPLGIDGLETYEQKKGFADAALRGLEGMLDLFVGTAHAEEFHAATAQVLDDARAAAQSVVIRQGRSLDPLPATDFDPDGAPSLGALSEGSVRSFTLYLPYDAGTGGQRVKLSLAGSAADKLAVLDQARETALGADGGFTLTVPEGRKELSFELWASQDIDAAETLALSAQLLDADDVPTHLGHVELDLALDAVLEAAPVTAREIHGDWAPKPYVDSATGATYYQYDDLGNIERLPGVPSTGDVEPDLWLDGSAEGDLIVTGDFDEQAHGDAGDDFITGSDRSGNVLYGGAGDDRIEGGGWADRTAESVDYLGRTMGLGDDRIYGGAGDDQIWGESEAAQDALNDAGTAPTGITGDWLTGGSGADRLYGSAGDDVLLGGSGEDLLVGGAGMDVLLGDDDYQLRPTGNYWQVVHPSFGDSTPGFGGFEVGLFPVVNATSAAPDLVWEMTGDPEFAYYKSGGGADVLIGGGGSDILIGEAGDDTLYGGEGDDILAGWEGDDELVGGAGDDMMAGDFGRYEQTNQRAVPGTLLVQAGVLGSSAAYGSAPELTGNDLLDGGAGNDVLYGEGGDDSVLGGDGDDTLYGDAAYLPESLHGNDILDGGAGNDVLYAGAGEDRLYGGAGNDALHGGAGNDRLEGGGGDDSLSGEQGDDRLSAGEGDDALYGGDGADVLYAGAGDDRLHGDNGDDVLYGESGADRLDGGAGNDRLYGGIGDDLIDGGAGDDLIDGGEGVDVLRGGAGDDTYLLGLGYGRDAIEDGEGANRIRFDSGILAGDLRAELDSDTLTATLGYTIDDDAVSLDMSDFALDGIDFIDGSAWTPKQLAGLIPALVANGWEDSETLEGNANLRNALHGGGGDDTLAGAAYDDLLDGGDGADSMDGRDGSDSYFFAGTESGIDLVADSGIDTNAYLDAYYAALGIADWRARGAHGGEYRVVQQAEGSTIDVYYDSYEQALAENPAAAIDFIEPLPELAPVVQRDDAAGLHAQMALGTVARDVVRFGPGVSLADLALRVAVPAASAEAYPDQPWHDGGTLSARWGAGGFDLAVPDAGYGFAGPSLPADPESYRLGEGIEAFELDDGTRYTLEEVLAQAAVLSLAGEYHLGRDAGPQPIAPNYARIVFDDFIRAYELQITREGADLVLDVGDGGTVGRIAGWYGSNGLTPPTSLSFYADPELDAAAVTAAGLELHGTEGDDLLQGLDGYADRLYGEGGNDVLDGGTGDDLLQGGDGADVYVLAPGGGHDVADNPYSYVWPSSDDRIRVADGLGPDDVLISHGYGDVSVWLRGSTTRIEVPQWSYDDARRLAGIEFADGTFWSADEMEGRFEPAPGTAGDDAIFGSDGDDVIDALAGDDYVETGAGNDIVRGGRGADDLEAWGEGNKLLDAGPGDDYVYEEGRTLVIGGAGEDWIDHFGDGGVIAFNPGDGDDTVYAAGAMTLSIGGGVQPGDLSLAQDGDDLVLEVAGAGSIRLTRQWEADPAAWPEITLQLFGSVHLYDFNAAIGSEGPLGEVLAANESSFSETDGLGGAIAWRYAMAGGTGALSDEQLASVIADPGFGTASQPIALEQPNRPPQLAEPITDRSVLEDSLFELSVAAAFSDPDLGDALSFDATLADGSPLPAWLAFDAAAASFAGTPGNDDVGTLEIAVGATDGAGERAEDSFALEVVNVNDPPILVAPLSDQSGQEGAALAFSVAGAFKDVDAGDALAYAATLADGGALPDWLAFDPASQSFSAAPGYSDGGSYLLRVTATDTAGASASGDFTLEIQQSEPPPRPDKHEHHGHEHGHEHEHDRRHDHHKGKEHKDKHNPRDLLRDRLAKPPHFDFAAIVRELERREPQPAPSPAEIRAGWERVARHAAKLRAASDDYEHGAASLGSALLRLAPNGGHAFGFDGSTGAARAQEGFTSFQGLSEGFRRL